MAKQVKRVVSSKRGNKKNKSDASTTKRLAALFPPPPPPFLCVSRGYLYDPEPTTLDVSVTVPLQQLQNRAAVHDTVLRSTLHRLHPAPSFSSAASASASSSTNADTINTTINTTTTAPTNTTHRTLVHVESITIHADSARQISHTGDVRLRATVKAVLARVVHGLFAGVAESTMYTDTMMVRVRREIPPTCTTSRDDMHTPHHNNNSNTNDNINNNNDNVNNNNNVDDTSLLITARCLEDEPVVAGQAVLLVSEPGTLRCLAIRPPRVAPGPFKLNIEDGVAEIQADWPLKGKRPRDEEGKEVQQTAIRTHTTTTTTTTETITIKKEIETETETEKTKAGVKGEEGDVEVVEVES